MTNNTTNQEEGCALMIILHESDNFHLAAPIYSAATNTNPLMMTTMMALRTFSIKSSLLFLHKHMNLLVLCCSRLPVRFSDLHAPTARMRCTRTTLLRRKSSYIWPTTISSRSHPRREKRHCCRMQCTKRFSWCYFSPRTRRSRRHSFDSGRKRCSPYPRQRHTTLCATVGNQLRPRNVCTMFSFTAIARVPMEVEIKHLQR